MHINSVTYTEQKDSYSWTIKNREISFKIIVLIIHFPEILTKQLWLLKTNSIVKAFYNVAVL